MLNLAIVGCGGMANWHAQQIQKIPEIKVAALVDIVLANNHPAIPPGATPSGAGPANAVKLRWPPSSVPVPRLILDDLVDTENAHHHDPARLAAAIIRAFEGEAGIRRRPAGGTATRSA